MGGNSSTCFFTLPNRHQPVWYQSVPRLPQDGISLAHAHRHDLRPARPLQLHNPDPRPILVKWSLHCGVSLPDHLPIGHDEVVRGHKVALRDQTHVSRRNRMGEMAAERTPMSTTVRKSNIGGDIQQREARARHPNLEAIAHDDGGREARQPVDAAEACSALPPVSPILLGKERAQPRLEGHAGPGEEAGESETSQEDSRSSVPHTHTHAHTLK